MATQDFFVVVIMEFERGFGSRIEEIKFFRCEQLAKNYVVGFNKPNTEKFAPDWYMQAYAPVRVTDIDTYKKIEKAFTEKPEANWVNV